VSLTALGEKLIAALPPAFIILVLLNCGFITFAIYTFNANVEARNAMLTRIIESCLVDRQKP
jgi:hypothetical protein